MATYIEEQQQQQSPPTTATLPQQRQSSLMASMARDLLSLLSLGLLLVCIHELATPFWRGFYCDDESIRYPYKESTVSSGVCYSVGSGINVLLVLVLEYLALLDSDARNNKEVHKVYVRNVCLRLTTWFFGAISSELLTDITKFTAGRLRPHFIDVCKPIVLDEGRDYQLADYCSNQSPSKRYNYITNYQCSGDPRKQRDARLSFLSGHSSYSSYSAMHAVFYIQSRMDVIRFGLMKPAVQVLIISAAFYTGLSRVSDYKHHWQDVLAGLSLGTLVAAIVHAYVWPSLYGNYTKIFKDFNQRLQTAQTGGELDSFSY